jgi:hypothetical protein
MPDQQTGAEGGGPSRRQVVTALTFVPLASLAPAIVSESRALAASGAKYRFFTHHEAAVIKAAAARLVPGPDDDPIENLLNSPGATEADVIRYIDTMLSMFDHDPPKIFAGGPYSDRHGGHINYMKHFVPPAPRQLHAWRKRVRQLRRQYRRAVRTLDAASKGGNFAAVSHSDQDTILVNHGTDRNLIFTHTIEGMYAVPEYGGNRHTLGWKSAGWPGDSQRRGYTAAQVEHSDGEDVVVVTGVVADLLNALPTAAQARRNRRVRRG